MTTLKTKIRPYDPGDLDEVINLLRLNTPKFFNIAEEVDLRAYFENRVEDYFLVELNNNVIGAGGINYFPAEKEARLSWDIIHPAYQKKGVGKQLLLYRLEKINSLLTVKKVVVRTTPLVYKFYESLGFITEFVQKDYWAPGLDLQVMTKENLRDNPGFVKESRI